MTLLYSIDSSVLDFNNFRGRWFHRLKLVYTRLVIVWIKLVSFKFGFSSFILDSSIVELDSFKTDSTSAERESLVILFSYIVSCNIIIIKFLLKKI